MNKENMTIKDAIDFLTEQVENPSEGLPDKVFYYISRTTPLINVDLLVKDENNRTLMTWRDDKYCGRGWHLPGGIIRFREHIETRLHKVALAEIGVDIEFEPQPVTVKECIHYERPERSHFISLLYRGYLPSSFVPDNKGLTETDPGFLKWFEGIPKPLLYFHDQLYREYF
jgi:colanic acid biosynthesis protein WcaH